MEKGNKCDMCTLFIVTLYLSTATSYNLPCYGCDRFYGDAKKMNLKRQTFLDECAMPCKCPLQRLGCSYGVSRIRDGCNCCYICARQHGDMCSRKNKCDVNKNLYCDFSGNSRYGICRATHPKSCFLNGVEYKDGEQFHLDCRRLCTCQNGNYGCAELCPQELKRPAFEYCKNAHLVSVRGQCCREWSCTEGNVTSKSPRHAELKSANLMMNLPPKDQTAPVKSDDPKTKCSKNGTQWSSCSVTCGFGQSYRLSPKSCGRVREIRLCFTRPCSDKPLYSVGRKQCTPTTRVSQRMPVLYENGKQNCTSVKSYRFKICTTCKKNKCCYPRRIQTRSLEFVCDGYNYQYFKYAWIKRCKCSRTCYKKKARGQKRNSIQ